MDKHYDVVVLGAGLTGLCTSYYLTKAGLQVKVIDTNNRVGGVIQTKNKNGFVYEHGPNTGILGSIEIAELFEELQDLIEIEFGNKNVSKRFILHKAEWKPLPSGLKEAVNTPLFSLSDKFRILGEPFRRPGKDENESLAGLVKRRMGQSFLDYAIDPFILGVYAGDPSYLITKYALPKLYNLEQDYGSFIGGAFKKKFEKKTEREKKATRKIFTVKKGLSALTNALYEKIGQEHFSLGAKHINVQQADNGYAVSLIDSNQTGHTIEAKKIITTIPAFELKNILSFVDTDLLEKAQNVYYAPVVEVAVGFNQWNGIPLDGFGGLIPHKENRDILGVMYMSSLFENRAPKEGALISVFIGGARKPELTTLNDEELKTLVGKEFKALMGLDEFNPDLFEIARHSGAIPQYGIESKARFSAVKEIQNKYRDLFVKGNLQDGIGMADRVKQAKQIADEIIKS